MRWLHVRLEPGGGNIYSLSAAFRAQRTIPPAPGEKPRRSWIFGDLSTGAPKRRFTCMNVYVCVRVMASTKVFPTIFSSLSEDGPTDAGAGR